MRSVNNDWEMFIEHEAKLCRQEQEREKHGKYGEISTINSEMKLPIYYWIGASHIFLFDSDNIGDESDNRPLARIDINDYDSIDEAERVAEYIVRCVNSYPTSKVVEMIADYRRERGME